jgi:peptide/nickel transport system substrate-binding protein
MRRKAIWLFAGVLAATALVVGPTASAEPQALPRGGTVVIGHDQEPATLNNLITPGNAYTTSLVTNLVLAGGMRYNGRAQLTPQLFQTRPRIVRNRPLTVRFTIKRNARWSDGRQVTGADWRATWQAIMNRNWDITSREGWEDINRVQVRGKTVTVRFRRPYAAWEPLVAVNIYPAHKLRGANVNQLYQSGLDVSSGPYRFVSWQKGTQLVLARNTTYRAGPVPRLDRLVFRYIPNPASLFQSLRSDEIQVTEPQPQLQIVDIRRNSQFRVQSGPGYFFEHMDFQFGPQGHPALKRRYVRQALIQGINRSDIRNALYVQPGLVASARQLPVLQSLIWKPFEPNYRPFFARWAFNQRNVIALLRRNGCTGGPATPNRNNTDVWSCPGVGRLSFRFNTTAGNQLRALTFEVAQAQLKSVGIELQPRFAANALTQVLPGRDWDISMFTWLGGPTSSITIFSLYGCGGDLNYMTYCNRAASRLLQQVQFTPNAARRRTLLHRAERIIANDVPSIPMYVRPGFLINNRKVTGLVINPTQQGSTWNSETWSTR